MRRDPIASRRHATQQQARDDLVGGADIARSETCVLYQYGVGIGIDLARHGKARAALPYLIRPVNYWRATEYAAVHEAAQFRANERVLDIGSPKLLSLYLAERVGAEVLATDIDDYFVDRLRMIARLRCIPPEKLQVAVEDGRRLTYPDASFDKVYSISVVEHVPEDGDSDCLAEIGRVLRQAGICVLTVPFSAQSRNEYRRGGFYWSGASKREAGGRIFYQRRYNEDDLRRRLIEPSGLRLRALSYIGDRIMTRSSREFSDYLPAISGPLQPILARLIHTPPSSSWRELKKPLCAVIVLEK